MLLTTFGNTVDVNIVFSHNTVLNKGHPYVRENLNGLFRTQVGIQYGVETQSFMFDVSTSDMKYKYFVPGYFLFI